MEWTLAELVRRVGEALTAAGLRAPNGRVTEVPDARLVRWYASIGLIDRPLAMRGRVAMYGPRHLLQLVAVKRRQSEGRSLAEIQAELAGATEATLTAVAGVDEVRRPEPATAKAGPRRAQFWAERPSVPAADVPVADVPVADVPAPAPPTPPAPARPVVLHGVAVDGLVLLLSRVPTSDDLAALSAAAEPLLAVLTERGLINPSEGASA